MTHVVLVAAAFLFAAPLWAQDRMPFLLDWFVNPATDVSAP